MINLVGLSVHPHFLCLLTLLPSLLNTCTISTTTTTSPSAHPFCHFELDRSRSTHPCHIPCLLIKLDVLSISANVCACLRTSKKTRTQSYRRRFTLFGREDVLLTPPSPTPQIAIQLCRTILIGLYVNDIHGRHRTHTLTHSCTDIFPKKQAT